MKTAIVFAVLSSLLWPAFALADPPDCARTLRQIYHHEDMAALAEERNLDEWAEKTRDHVERLEERLAVRCPRYSDRDEKQDIARSIAKILKTTAGAAAKLLTLGAL